MRSILTTDRSTHRLTYVCGGKQHDIKIRPNESAVYQYRFLPFSLSFFLAFFLRVNYFIFIFTSHNLQGAGAFGLFFPSSLYNFPAGSLGSIDQIQRQWHGVALHWRLSISKKRLGQRRESGVGYSGYLAHAYITLHYITIVILA